MAVKKRAATLAEIAKVAGVSRMTASRALNNQPGVSAETREDILRIADEMQEALGVSELEIDYVPQPVELPCLCLGHLRTSFECLELRQ